MKKKNIRKNSLGSITILILVLCGIALFNFPLFSGDESSSVFRIITEGSVYSAVAAVLLAFPLALMLAVTILPFDVIKKYVVCFFVSIWLILGYVALCMIFYAKFTTQNIGIGLAGGTIDAVLLLVTAIVGNIKDKSSRVHKDLIWYNGLNKILLFVSLPLFAASTVFIAAFHIMVFSFPIIIVFGIISAWLCTLICSFVSICALFAKYKFGILHYVTAFLSVIAVMGILISSGVAVMIFGFLISVAFAVFFMIMGNVARRNFFN